MPNHLLHERLHIHTMLHFQPGKQDPAALGDDSQQAVALRLVVTGRTQRMR